MSVHGVPPQVADPPRVPDPLAGRLRDAIARPDAALPDGLVEATMAAVRGTRQDRPGLRVGILAAAAAVLVVAFVGVYAVALPREAEPTGTATPAAVVASPGTPAPTATTPVSGEFPVTVLGLDVVSVSDALAVRDPAAGPGTPVPLAVRGWYTNQGPIPCPAPGPVDALETRCPGAFTWLTQEREVLVTATENTITGRIPTSSALNPRFLGGVAAPEVPTGRALGRKLVADPIPVVLVGHWNDGRAAFCTAEAAATCAREFVVDGVASALGEPVAPMLLVGTDRTPTLAAADVVARAESTLEGWVAASLAVYPREELAQVDPRLLDRDVPVAGDIAWVARMIRRGEEPMTLLVSDLDGSTARLPAWPVRGPVVDGLTGEIVSVPQLTNSRCTDTTEIGGYLAWGDDGASSPVRLLTFDGGIPEWTVFTYVPDLLVARRLDEEVSLLQPGGHVVVTPGWHRFTVCTIVRRAGFLVFPVLILEVDGEPLPAYQLVCGSLDRETCLRLAAEVEETVASQHPGRKLVSLTISDPCGTFMALLDDNTGLAVLVDCFLPTPSPSPSPSITSTACGSDPSGTCAGLVDLVRRADPVAFARAARVVVVETCPPGARCLMTSRPSLYVVLVPDAWDGTAATLDVWLAQGESYDTAIDPGPPSAARLADPVPEHVVAAVAAAQP